VRNADITCDAIGTDLFDLVHARAVLQHLAQREAILEKMIAAAKPGGWIVVSDVDWIQYDAQPVPEPYPRRRPHDGVSHVVSQEAAHADADRAGQADREDGWNSSYQDSDAYQDSTYGYDGYYVDLNEYQYYFRQGFQRGYEDGYNGSYQYGAYSNGTYSILDDVLNLILDIRAN